MKEYEALNVCKLFEGLKNLEFQEIEIIWGIKASWTTEIGAAGAIHDVHGVYLAEVYGNLGTCQAAWWGCRQLTNGAEGCSLNMESVNG